MFDVYKLVVYPCSKSTIKFIKFGNCSIYVFSLELDILVFVKICY